VIVLDTHVWLWWMTDPSRLSDPARAVVERSASIGVSTLSAWEVAMLVARGRITLDRDVGLWIRQALASDRVESLAPGAQTAVEAGLLDQESFPGDPVDRLIYATTVYLDARLVTRDRAIRAFDPERTVW
jgi:PIN domain nuclease of toxin-antitoxin system